MSGKLIAGYGVLGSSEVVGSGPEGLAAVISDGSVEYFGRLLWREEDLDSLSEISTALDFRFLGLISTSFEISSWFSATVSKSVGGSVAEAGKLGNKAVLDVLRLGFTGCAGPVKIRANFGARR